MNASNDSGRTMTVLKILHKYLCHEAAAWEEKDADLATKEHLLEVIRDASCVLAQLRDEDLRKRHPRVDDTRLFGYTPEQFGKMDYNQRASILQPVLDAMNCSLIGRS